MTDRLETLKAAIKAHGEAVVSIIPNHNPCGVVHADADQWDMLVSAGDAEKKARADLMPTEQDAIDLMHQAHLRLRELGWREAIYCPKDGSEFDVVEAGSTGIHRAHYFGTWPTGGWMVAGDGDLWPSHPCLYRPTAAELADREERAKRFRQLATEPPHRVQLSRKKGWKMPANTVSVARPGRWGNPYRVGPEMTAASAVAAFQALHVKNLPVAELRGKNLACWCPLDQPCHADVLLQLANDNRPRTIFSDDVDPAAREEVGHD